MPNNRLLAGAVALGALLIAAGLSQGRRDVVPEAPRPPASPSLRAPEPSPRPPDASADPDAALRAGLTTEVQAALAAMKPALVKRCWEPAQKQSPAPLRAPYHVQMTIDVHGKPGNVVIAMPRVGSRTDVWTCLLGVPLDFVVTPPPKPVYVEVLLTFP